ncbi:hypothetical protein Ahia01_000189500 [Argonauta hians]
MRHFHVVSVTIIFWGEVVSSTSNLHFGGASAALLLFSSLQESRATGPFYLVLLFSRRSVSHVHLAARSHQKEEDSPGPTSLLLPTSSQPMSLPPTTLTSGIIENRMDNKKNEKKVFELTDSFVEDFFGLFAEEDIKKFCDHFCRNTEISYLRTSRFACKNSEYTDRIWNCIQEKLIEEKNNLNPENEIFNLIKTGLEKSQLNKQLNELKTNYILPWVE